MNKNNFFIYRNGRLEKDVQKNTNFRKFLSILSGKNDKPSNLDPRMDFLANYKVLDGFMVPFVSPFGKITKELLKNRIIKYVFDIFENILFFDTPLIQKHKKQTQEHIKIDNNITLRKTFHDLYFTFLKEMNLKDENYPIRFLEVGCIFRKENNMFPFKRSTYFEVADIHSFCKGSRQVCEEIVKCMNLSNKIRKDLKLRTICFASTSLPFSEIKDMLDVVQSEVKKPILFTNESEEESDLNIDFLVLEDNEVLEVGSLEIDSSRVKFMGKDVVLVDFTIGGIERLIYASNKCLKDSDLFLPEYLYPVQILLIPRESKYIKKCEKMAMELNGIRYAIDDRKIPFKEKLEQSSKGPYLFTVIVDENLNVVDTKGDSRNFEIILKELKKDNQKINNNIFLRQKLSKNIFI